jgi:hypothetical protein
VGSAIFVRSKYRIIVFKGKLQYVLPKTYVIIIS